MTEETVGRHVERMEARGGAQVGAQGERGKAGLRALGIDAGKEAGLELAVEAETLRRRLEAGIGAGVVARNISGAIVEAEVAGQRRQGRKQKQDKDDKAAHLDPWPNMLRGRVHRRRADQIAPAVCRRERTGASMRSIASEEGFTSP